MYTFLILFFLVTTSQCQPKRETFTSICKQGPSVWCQDAATAIECGVVEFCNIQEARPEGVSRNSDVKPIQIDLYYEAFCGGCQKFIKEQLYQAFQKLYQHGVFEISLFPYGNANEKKVGDKWEFECQHGEGECQMNLIETCAVHLLPHPKQFMPYIHCIESDPTLANAQKCAKDLQIEWAPISACYNGSEGNILEHQMAQRTDALQPKHHYVPWLVIDGVHTERMQTDAQVDLMEFLCDHFKGTKPAECKGYLSSKRENRCYK